MVYRGDGWYTIQHQVTGNYLGASYPLQRHPDVVPFKNSEHPLPPSALWQIRSIDLRDGSPGYLGTIKNVAYQTFLRPSNLPREVGSVELVELSEKDSNIFDIMWGSFNSGKSVDFSIIYTRYNFNALCANPDDRQTPTVKAISLDILNDPSRFPPELQWVLNVEAIDRIYGDLFSDNLVYNIEHYKVQLLTTNYTVSLRNKLFGTYLCATDKRTVKLLDQGIPASLIWRIESLYNASIPSPPNSSETFRITSVGGDTTLEMSNDGVTLFRHQTENSALLLDAKWKIQFMEQGAALVSEQYKAYVGISSENKAIPRNHIGEANPDEIWTLRFQGPLYFAPVNFRVEPAGDRQAQNQENSTRTLLNTLNANFAQLTQLVQRSEQRTEELTVETMRQYKESLANLPATLTPRLSPLLTKQLVTPLVGEIKSNSEFSHTIGEVFRQSISPLLDRMDQQQKVISEQQKTILELKDSIAKLEGRHFT